MNDAFILEIGQRVGWTLVHSVWQFALIALLLAIAVHMTGDRVGYAKLLLWLEESRSPSALVTLGISSGGGSLLDRIRRIVSASPQATGVGTLAISTVVFLIVSIGSLLVMSVGSTSAQENTKPAVAPRDIATIRSWMKRTVEFEDWSRLTGLAKRMAEEGEYEEAIEWLTKIPLGEYKDGKFPPDWYYKVITEICENALKHDRLDFVENELEELLNAAKQSPTSKQFPPRVFDVAIAILEYHLSKGELDKAFDYLNSHPVGSHADLVHGAAARASHNGQAETYDREFGKNNQSWSIYRTITDERVVKDPAQLLAAMQLVLKQVPFDPKDYFEIAVKHAKLLGKLHPDQPLPAEWLEKLNKNPKLKYQVELAHAHGCWEKTESP